MVYRTYQIGGDFVSVNLSVGDPPTEFDASWEIDADAFAALSSVEVPVIEESGDLLIAVDEFPPDPE